MAHADDWPSHTLAAKWLPPPHGEQPVQAAPLTKLVLPVRIQLESEFKSSA